MTRIPKLLLGVLTCALILVGVGLVVDGTTSPVAAWPKPTTEVTGGACTGPATREDVTVELTNLESGYPNDPGRISNVKVWSDPASLSVPPTATFSPNPVPNTGDTKSYASFPVDYRFVGTVYVSFKFDWQNDNGYNVQVGIPVVECEGPVTTTTTAVTTTSTSTTIPTTTTTAPSTTTTTRPTTTTTRPVTTTSTSTTSTSTTSTSTTSTTQPSTTTTTEPETTTTTSTIPETTTTTQPDGSTTTTSTVVTTSSTTTPVPPTTTPDEPTTTVTDLTCEEVALNEGRTPEACTTTQLPVTGASTQRTIGYAMLITGIGGALLLAAYVLKQRQLA